MANRALLIASASVLLFVVTATGEPKFGGENVCNKTLTVRRDKRVGQPVKYEIQYDGICGILPCTKTRVETRMDYQLKTTYEEMNVAVCCPGYAETPDRECAPICLKPCNHGSCAAPGLCKCDPEPTETSPGFVGSACNRFACLASNRWGTTCDKECNCPPNSYCSASTGKCICRNGWRGANCTEECDSSMNCNEVELPPVIEPDSNIISDSMIQSQKLENLSPRALLREFEIAEEQNPSSYNFSTFNIGMNLFLLTLVGCLVFAIWRVKNRLNMIKNEIYYEPSSNSSPGSNYASQSFYSGSSNATSVQGRPRMPTPGEAGLFGKNLSFDAATRYVLLGGAVPTKSSPLAVVKTDSKVEAHLITSQESSKQNLYSDLDVVTSKAVSASSKPIQGDQMLRISTTASTDATSHYQVPKSPAIVSIPLENEETSGIYENDVEQNLYEEIKPRSPHKEL